MPASARGLTLVEVMVCTGLVGLVGWTAAGINSHLSEEARTAKCQSNLQRQINAIHQYTADYDGVLPGPVHPALRRFPESVLGPGPSPQRPKSLTWLLRPYFPVVGHSATNPDTPNPIVDELASCPTATMIVPDWTFPGAIGGGSSCTATIPFSYVCNTWGPVSSPGSPVGFGNDGYEHTDPPHYFGAWFQCDATPDRPDVCWKPKRLDAIANPASEWATADAWYRRIGQGAPRVGPQPRIYMGTFAFDAPGYPAPIPSMPYHRIAPEKARSHDQFGTSILPSTDFEGETNQAYFDGHVAPFKGNWRVLGDGGTVNPYWITQGGTNLPTDPWDTTACNTP
jgi:prepilin-type processing-associated H-X9-DG protein